MRHITPKLYTAAILIQGAILCLPLCLLFARSWQVHFSWTGLFAVIYLGICCSWLAYKCWNIGLQKTPAHISGMLIALEPVFGVLIAMLFRRAHDLADCLRQCISHCFGGGFDPDPDSAAKTASGRIEWKFS